MATVAPPEPIVLPGPVTLRNVEWSTYRKLRDDPDNDDLRMAYIDGELTIMSPMLRHDGRSRRIYDVVRTVAVVWEINYMVLGTTTLRREGRGPMGGVAKEPDEGFYLGDNEALVRDNDEINLDVDPPPDLAIEVDNSRDSGSTLPTYARIGVPEVWLYNARRRTLWFGRLEGDAYVEVDRSLGLPRLTPALILQALDARTPGMGDLRWGHWLNDWARGLPEPPPAAR